MDIRTRAIATPRPTAARPAVQATASPRPAAKAASTPAVKPLQTPNAYADAVKALEAAIAKEASLTIQKGAESRLYLHADRPAKGTIVMYHGFTAGTWQFELLAQKAYDDGYNVYVPRLPGHGLKDAKGAEDPSDLVASGDAERYDAFAEDTYRLAKALGGPVHVMGLSVGGDVALAVAEKHPDVADVVVYAPFLRHKNMGWFFDAFHALDKVTFGKASKLLDKIPFSWDKQTQADTATGKRPGHSKFDLGNLYAASELGRRLIANASALKSPVQYFVTGADDAANEAAIRKVHDLGGGNERNGWYYYPKSEGIPHPMLHPMEDKGKGQTPALYDMTMQFLDGHQPLDRGE